MADQVQIHCIAIDDEPPALEIMKNYIEAVPVLHLEGAFANAVDALSLLQKTPVDLLFLDIQMPHILGTNFIRTLAKPPKVIFTTAYRKFAVEGFDLDAVDYILKPVSFERFLKAVNKVMRLNLPVSENFPLKTRENTNENEYIYLRADRKNIKVKLSDLLFIESLKDYIKVVTKDRTIVSKNSISVLEERLPASFIRIHRSFIVSVNKIDSFTHDLIQIGKFELPVSRSYRHQVEKVLHI
jgi:DNA-binding LytR/AlgR family response regulator